MKDDTLILKATGPDAGTFLQEHLVCDKDALARGYWHCAACCNPHDTVLAVLWLIPWPDGILLRLPRSVAAVALAQLRQHTGARDITLEETALHFAALAGDNPDPERHIHHDDGIARLGGITGLIPVISAQPLPDALPGEAWYAARIRAGIAEIHADTAGHYAPHTLHLAPRDHAPHQKKPQHQLATATAPGLASGQRTLYNTHHKPVGTLLDYGHDTHGTVAQGVIDSHYLNKPLHLRDHDQTLTFHPVTAKNA